ncbi:ADP-ribosylglycohydrolase [Amniculicola lignicola CBS 123094]|uniref:ADP-ribosylglycohydrolase n=1 Tax=Amniculicola lignicola CBS 123094 TaxID=1392246 RepID=A0A6A5VU20_9PLEO|nr:ADP-ribosylglycohydrolase [Amniculicola lignicola CBS 123094]
MSTLPDGYLHKIYAGVLGKLIGVYLGRPFENWTYQEIQKELGPIHHYVHKRLNLPLVVIDDDVSGTFTFVRALEEHGSGAELTPEEVGKTWLNNVIDRRTIFWWGGHGISTEHTVYNNLKNGIQPPLSGSIKTNGKTIAEQIGSQIFIDGWALVAPGNPALAARLSEAAARVSHDGIAVNAAVLWAVMESEAFVSKDVDHLLSTGLSYIPSDSLIAELIKDIRAWHKEDGDWEKTRQRIEDNYGYDKYGGICHMVPNHGIMIMSLLYGGHDFTHAMHIINTSGWDTDCNSGNVGCLVAIMHSLSSFDGGLDWRSELADRALISGTDNGYSVNDAVRITYDLANMARKLVGQMPLEAPKDGAQFHFSLPGSTQGFQSPSPPEVVTVQHGQDRGVDALGVHLTGSANTPTEVEVLSQTFTPREAIEVKRDYEMMASPLIYPGQRISAILTSSAKNTSPTSIKLRIKAYNSTDELITVDSDRLSLPPGSENRLEWTIPSTLNNKPIQQLGLTIAAKPQVSGTVWLHSLRWDGIPTMELARPRDGKAQFWQYAWVNSIDKVHTTMGPSFYLAHDKGEGIFTHGTRDWTDYSVTATKLVVNLGAAHGVVIRAQGLNRYYAFIFQAGGKVAIVKTWDEKKIELATGAFEWALDQSYDVTITVQGNKIVGKVGDVEIEAIDEKDSWKGGAAGFVVTEGSLSSASLKIAPLR